MKVALNDETNPNTQSVRPPHVPSIVNLQHFTSGSSVRKRETSRFDRTLIMHANVYDQDQGLTGRYHNTTLQQK